MLTKTARTQLRLANFLLLVLALLSICAAPTRADWLWGQPGDRVYVDSAHRNNVFYVGQPLTFTMTGWGNGTEVTRYEVRDYYGNLVDSGPHGPTTSFTVRSQPPGWYKIYLYHGSVIDAWGYGGLAPIWGYTVGGTNFVVMRDTPGFPALPAKNTQAPYGSGMSDQIIRGVTGMGPQRHKVDDAAQPDAAIAALESDIALDRQYYLPYDPIRKRSLMIAFPNGTHGMDAGLRQIVAHFQNDVQYWEPRNEPENTDPTTFINTELKPFYETIKSVNPNMKVMGPGIVTVGPNGLGWLERFFKAGGGRYIDVFSFHAYNNVNGDVWLARKSMTALTQLLTKYGLGNMEKWQTEQGYMAACYGDYQPRLQGRWTMLQRMVFEQNGIPKEHDHLWHDRPGYWDVPMFFENEDGSLNPAAPLMRVWSEELYGTTFSKAYGFGFTGNKLYAGSLYEGPGKRVAAFLSAGSTDGKVVLRVTGGSSLHVVSAFGVAQDLPVTGGQVTLSVPEEPVYVEMTPGQDIAVIPQSFGPDLALSSTPSSSGTGAHPVDSAIPNDISKLINGQMESWYWDGTYPWMDNTAGSPAWVQLQWPTPQTLDHVIIYACPPWQWQGTLLDYELQYDNAGQWVTIERVQEPVNTFAVPSLIEHTSIDSFFSDRWIFQHQFSPIQTRKIRVLVHDMTWGGGATQAMQLAGGQTGPHQINLREIEAYNSSLPLVPTPFRIDCGSGSAYTDSVGNLWQADGLSSGGSIWTFPGTVVTGTPDPPLYPSVRYGDRDFSYGLPAAPGAYTLRLHFVEGDFHAATPGGRLFNVLLNGAPLLNNLDVWSEAGGLGKALVKSFPVTVGDDGVSLQFEAVASSAMVSAIELVPSGPPPPRVLTRIVLTPGAVTLTPGSTQAFQAQGLDQDGAPLSPQPAFTWSTSGGGTVNASGLLQAASASGGPFTLTATSGSVSGTATFTLRAAPVAGSVRVDCGGASAYTDSAGNLWQADASFAGGSTWTFSPLSVTGTPDPPLYPSVRYDYGRFSYTLAATAGAAYTLRLHFVEGDPRAASPGARLFNVLVDGRTVLSNFDVAATAGGVGKALVQSLPVTAGSGNVTVTFEAVRSSAMVSAIELVPSGPPPPRVLTRIVLTPGAVTLTPGSTQAFQAQGLDQDGAPLSPQPAFTWSTSGGGTVNASGLLQAASASGGPFTLTATSGSVSGTATFTLRAAPVAGSVRVDCGGASAYTDSAGNLWQADASFAGGSTWTFSPLSVTGTPDPPLYPSVRYDYGRFSYTLAATAGAAYTLRLHFVEGDPQAGAPGARLFNVLVDGRTVLSNFDVAATAGGVGKALVQSLPVTAGSGNVTVSFVAVRSSAMVSAIELVPRTTP